jgi:hypothetical protein
MTLKQFSQAQYDADDNCKHDVITFLERESGGKFKLTVNTDLYGIDLVGEYNGIPCGVEVEIKHCWSGQHFPFSTVHIAARKVKFIECKPYVFFVMLNTERTEALVVSPDSLQDITLVKKPTIHTDTEWFMKIPLHQFKQYQL